MTTFEQRNLWVNLTPISREEFIEKITSFKAKVSKYEFITNISFIGCMLCLVNSLFSAFFGALCYGTSDGIYFIVSGTITFILMIVLFAVGKNYNIKRRKFEKVVKDNPIPDGLVSSTDPASYLAK